MGDVWLIKTDSQGNKEWDKTFGGLDDDAGRSVQQTQDGGYIIVGETMSYRAFDYDVWLIKTDPSGNKEWDKIFGGTRFDFGHSVRQTSDGGYIIAGRTASYGTGGLNVWLIKTDSGGNESWNKTFRRGSGYSVEQTSDGGYIIAGETYVVELGFSDVWLIKTDSSGNELWNETFGGSNDDAGSSVEQTSDGGYIVAAHTNSYGAGEGDVWLIKTDSSGNERWNETFGGSYRDGGNSVRQTSDGGYVIAGFTSPYGFALYDVWLIKVKEEEAGGLPFWTWIIMGVGAVLAISFIVVLVRGLRRFRRLSISDTDDFAENQE
jgi:hypothetical protein